MPAAVFEVGASAAACMASCDAGAPLSSTRKVKPPAVKGFVASSAAAAPLAPGDPATDGGTQVSDVASGGREDMVAALLQGMLRQVPALSLPLQQPSSLTSRKCSVRYQGLARHSTACRAALTPSRTCSMLARVPSRSHPRPRWLCSSNCPCSRAWHMSLARGALQHRALPSRTAPCS